LSVHLTALVDAVDHVCCRYRLAALRPHLERAGHRLELRPLPRTWWRRFLLFRSLRGANVILQRRLPVRWELALLRHAAARLFFDFDDAVFLRDSYAAAGLHDARRQRRFQAVVAACDAVVAGNAWLAEAASRHTAAESVHVVPTCVEPAQYPEDEFPIRPVCGRIGNSSSEITLVWIGSSSTLQGLERIRPLLEEIGARVPNVRLKVICDRFPKLERLPVVAVPWSAATEAAELASADVGIAWIPNDDWSRGKCGLKVLQYMAAGLPVVANPVGVHVEMVRHGESGFQAVTTDEWVAAVSRLAADAELRRRLGLAGRRRLETDYAVTTAAARWLDLLGGLESAQVRSA
jgi:glycosyltransferase involved in cell wall biosynthesis